MHGSHAMERPIEAQRTFALLAAALVGFLTTGEGPAQAATERLQPWAVSEMDRSPSPSSPEPTRPGSRPVTGTEEPGPSSGRASGLRDAWRHDGAEVNVLDASGRRLHTPLDRQLPAGRHDFGWDLRNDNGDRLPSGIYFLQLQVDGRQEPRKITIVK